jgi:hypothetical protein
MSVEAVAYIATAYAAIVATAALALEIRRWVESGPRLSLSVMAPAVVAGDDDNREFIFVGVTNRGSMATTITHFGFLEFSSWWRRFRNRASWSAIVPHPQYAPVEFPYVLEPGTRWNGGAVLQDEVLEKANRGNLYVAIHHSHRSRPALRRVVLSKPSTDEA